MTWTALRALVAQGAPELVAFANDPEIRNLCREAALNDSGLSNWVHAGLDDARVKVLVGVRGANKTGALLAVRDWLRARGVEEARLVSLDFEDVRFRHFATADDVLCHLEDLPPCAAPVVGGIRERAGTGFLPPLSDKAGGGGDSRKAA